MATEAPLKGSISKTSTASTEDTIAPVTGPRIFHVGRSGLTFTHVLDSDNSTYLYIIDTNRAGLKDAPEVMIKSAQTSRVVGTIMGYALTKKMDLTVNDKPMPLEAMGALSTGRVYTSHADSGRKYKWTYDNALSHDLVCEDEDGNVVASWKGSSAVTGGDNFFKVEPGFAEGELLDEVLISGLAMVEHRAKRNRHGFGGAVCAGLRMAAHPFQGSSK